MIPLSSNPYLLLMLFCSKPLKIATFVLKTFQVLYFSNKIRTDAKIPSDAISTNGNVVFLYFEITVIILCSKFARLSEILTSKIILKQVVCADQFEYCSIRLI